MASNIRVLVSNLGDGDWGVVGTTDADANKIDFSKPGAPAATGDSVIYFPPVLNANGTQAKGTVPDPVVLAGISPAAAAPNGKWIGFTSKTQWMVQIAVASLGTAGAPSIVVSAVRPTGVEEVVLSTTVTGTFSYGGFDDEAIQGPIAYFKFESNATGGTVDARCYVIGWNYGDVSDGFAS